MKTKPSITAARRDAQLLGEIMTLEQQRRQKLLEHQRAYMREYRAGKRRRDKK